MNLFKLLELNLNLFDGAASGGGAPTGGDGTGTDGGESSAKGETQAISGSTRRGASGEYQNVLFGKQDKPEQSGADSKPDEQKAQSSDAGKDKKPDVTVTSNTLEERRKNFDQLINGEYKDIYTEETQKIIDRRFRETKSLEQQLSKNQPVIDMLMQRYGIADGDVQKLMSALESDNAYWNAAAEEAGMDVEQYKEYQRLRRENKALLREQQQRQSEIAAERQLKQWHMESEQVKAAYPEFDLASESKNPQFVSLLRSGVPIKHAYEVIHMDDIKAGVFQSAAKQTEKQVVDNIRSKGARPSENGTSSQSAFTVKEDPHKWSKQDRLEVIRRVERGETIKL